MTKSDRAKNEQVIRVRFYVSELRFLAWILAYFIEDMRAFERQLRIAELDAYKKRDLVKAGAGWDALCKFKDAKRLYNDLRGWSFCYFKMYAGGELARIQSLLNGGRMHPSPIRDDMLPVEI